MWMLLNGRYIESLERVIRGIPVEMCMFAFGIGRIKAERTAPNPCRDAMVYLGIVEQRRGWFVVVTALKKKAKQNQIHIPFY